MTAPESREAELRQLWRARPRSLGLRASLVVAVALVVAAWLLGGFEPLLTERSSRNLLRFLGEVRPYPFWDAPPTLGGLLDWLGATLDGPAREAVVRTVALSVLAIELAAVVGAASAVLAARSLATPAPFLPTPGRAAPWRVLVFATRALQVFGRAVPEYIWAFLLLAVLGLGPWPAVLALALHNAGILGKLGSELIEDLEPRVPRALRGLGATRGQLAATVVFEATLTRYLLFVFTRWETCVREATVLGMLGVVSLGWLISDARARTHYDELVLFVLVGSVLVMVGDALSVVVRRSLRS